MHQQKPASERGQSLVELTLFVPILIFMLIGMIEIGAYINSYINTLDASRASARYVSPLDPAVTRCQPFGSNATGRWISTFTTNCEIDGREYPAKAAEVKSWGMNGAHGIYDTCKTSPTVNFFYVAGCLSLLNMTPGFIEPENNFDDIVVTTIPVAGGNVAPGAVTWSFFGNQPISTSASLVVNITNPSNNSFTINPTFSTNLGQYANAPSTGLVVVEVYHAHPQVTKLFSFISRAAGGNNVLPDPIPVHTFSIFPLPAAEPR